MWCNNYWCISNRPQTVIDLLLLLSSVICLLLMLNLLNLFSISWVKQIKWKMFFLLTIGPGNGSGDLGRQLFLSCPPLLTFSPTHPPKDFRFVHELCVSLYINLAILVMFLFSVWCKVFARWVHNKGCGGQLSMATSGVWEQSLTFF